MCCQALILRIDVETKQIIIRMKERNKERARHIENKETETKKEIIMKK